MTDKDPFVAVALRSVDAPPPRAGFWDDVVHLLADDSAPSPGLPVRRRRRPWLLATAAGLAGATAMTAVLLWQPADDAVTVDPGRTPATASTTPSASPTATARAVDGVRRWIAAVAAGDGDTAWAMTGAQSREQIGGRPAFDRAMESDLREGWGAWDGVEPLRATGLRIGPAPTSPGDLVVVTLTGKLAQEGTTYDAAAGMVVSVTGEQVQVEPFVPGRSAGLVGLEPEPDGSAPHVGAGGPIAVHVDGDAAHYVVAIDGTAVPESWLERGPDGSVRAVRPRPPLSAGRHTVTVAFVLPSGTVAADAAVFVAD